MLTLASLLPVPRMLWALLLLAASGSAESTEWDSPSCTEGVVSVSRGESAVMACNISNPFSHINITLCTYRGESRQLVFSEPAPGDFSRDGWRLWVQGGQAQLVIEKAQDAQAGQYRWILTGNQRNSEITTLNVSEPQDTFFTPSYGPETLLRELRPDPEGTGQAVVLILVMVALVALVVPLACMLAWRRRHGALKLYKLLQHSLLSLRAAAGHLRGFGAEGPQSRNLPGVWTPQLPRRHSSLAFWHLRLIADTLLSLDYEQEQALGTLLPAAVGAKMQGFGA
ncbi:secreted and transmembrane protein 1 isoform X1 [Camelus dromedarius]|uniref:secreted and transmembrane protein 1 isoform X1 n=1 Tax=Camelus dromedarius TaxID=9838 RepID=UPI001263AE78|nr:secreted and transmembrane protein 1 isoform X5 [Camelus dromedarius]